MAQGVVEQVAEHLSEPVGVDADLAGIGELGAQVYPLGGVSVAGDVGGRGLRSRRCRSRCSRWTGIGISSYRALSCSARYSE